MGAVALTGQNRELAELMKSDEYRILEPIEGHKIDQRPGVVLVFCGDGDQSQDIFEQQVKIVKGQIDDPRIHLVALNAGPLLLVKNSPLHSRLPQDQVVLLNCAEGLLLKKMKVVVLLGHTCGKAMQVAKYSLERIFDEFVEAHDRIKSDIFSWIETVRQDHSPEFDNVEIKSVCTPMFFHVDWGGGKKKTYYFNRQNYLAYKSGLRAERAS
jgi:hypothetical protein